MSGEEKTVVVALSLAAAFGITGGIAVDYSFAATGGVLFLLALMSLSVARHVAKASTTDSRGETE